ncbi:MAG: LuxR C-terminal-related transcriptional regulator [Chloroflexota bacterium]
MAIAKQRVRRPEDCHPASERLEALCDWSLGLQREQVELLVRLDRLNQSLVMRSAMQIEHLAPNGSRSRRASPISLSLLPERATSLLGRRQLEVARIVADGRFNDATTAQLGLSRERVADHVQQALIKLTLTSRTQLAAWVFEHSYAGPGRGRPDIPSQLRPG